LNGKDFTRSDLSHIHKYYQAPAPAAAPTTPPAPRENSPENNPDPEPGTEPDPAVVRR